MEPSEPVWLGRFFVDGRADDKVVTGGENVFPRGGSGWIVQGRG
ncbi:hypothetical protein [Kribbella sp. DT2]